MIFIMTNQILNDRKTVKPKKNIYMAFNHSQKLYHLFQNDYV